MRGWAICATTRSSTRRSGARGLAAGWHAGLRQGHSGEQLARFAYDYQFNPAGGFAEQGDAVISFFRFYENLAERIGRLA